MGANAFTFVFSVYSAKCMYVRASSCHLRCNHRRTKKNTVSKHWKNHSEKQAAAVGKRHVTG